MSTSQSNNQNQTQTGDESAQPIDLAKKIEDAKKAAEQTENSAGSIASQSGATSSDDPAALKLQLEQMTEMAKRTMADMQNLKRRQDDERRLIITMANVDIMRSLLPVVDNLERAFKHIPESVKTDQAAEWLKGLEISAKQLSQALADSGLKPIEALNQPFNPDLHEALSQGPGPKDTIIEELEKGYMLGDRVIRHAKVKIGQT